MELTKYNHACFIITKGTDRVMVDPGGFTELPENLQHLNTLVITHSHGDHLDKANLDKIIAANPDIQIYGTPEVANEITAPHVIIPETDQDYTAASFVLRFYGGQHAANHKDLPVIGNFGVSVDGQIYYPGDSFSPGPAEVKLLMIPAAAPWMKIGEAIDFLLAQKPQIAIPTHDAILNESGQGISDMLLGNFAQKIGTEYKRLKSGESITV